MNLPTLTARPIGACPFCKGIVAIVDEPQALIHSEPTCSKFDEEEPLVFLRGMRLATVGPLPDDDEWPLPLPRTSLPS